MKINTVAVFLSLATAAVLSLAGCGATDVVAKFSTASFSSMISASAGRVAWSGEDSSWSLKSPDGDEVLFSLDFSRNSDNSDMAFAFDAAPFIAAGLDFRKLPVQQGIKYEIEDGILMLRFELGSDKFAPGAEKSIDAVFAEIAQTQRARIGYHMKLDHYGIDLGGGNMLEWAKDMAVNDKDLVFVLSPAPFIAAGVDPAKVAGWIFAKVEMMDDAGKPVFEDKLLRPFDLK